VRVFATYNIKGGVGKTATAVNLAYLAAASGARTLIWDLDPQGAATFYFRIRAKIKGGGKKLVRGRSDLDFLIRGTDFEGLDLLPADFSYRHMDLALEKTKKPTKRLARLLQPLAAEYDYLFLDCAPSISLVSESVFVAADALLVPTIPTTLSLRTLDQLCRYLDERQRRRPMVMPFFCMIDRRKSLHRRLSESTD
jgi:cellulose biosynthesis protein BcsQ